MKKMNFRGFLKLAALALLLLSSCINNQTRVDFTPKDRERAIQMLSSDSSTSRMVGASLLLQFDPDTYTLLVCDHLAAESDVSAKVDIIRDLGAYATPEAILRLEPFLEDNSSCKRYSSCWGGFSYTLVVSEEASDAIQRLQKRHKRTDLTKE